MKCYRLQVVVPRCWQPCWWSVSRSSLVSSSRLPTFQLSSLLPSISVFTLDWSALVNMTCTHFHTYCIRWQAKCENDMLINWIHQNFKSMFSISKKISKRKHTESKYVHKVNLRNSLFCSGQVDFLKYELDWYFILYYIHQYKYQFLAWSLH